MSSGTVGPERQRCPRDSTLSDQKERPRQVKGVPGWALMHLRSARLSPGTAGSVRTLSQAGLAHQLRHHPSPVPTREAPAGCASLHSPWTSGPQFSICRVEVMAGSLMTMRPQERDPGKWMSHVSISSGKKGPVLWVWTPPCSAPCWGHHPSFRCFRRQPSSGPQHGCLPRPCPTDRAPRPPSSCSRQAVPMHQMGE